MEQVLTDLSGASLSHAIQANFFEFLATQRLWSGSNFHKERHIVWSLSEIPFQLFNFVLPVDFPEACLKNGIARTLSEYGEHRLPVNWRFAPELQPADLGNSLMEQGFALRGNEPGMAIDLQNLKRDFPLSPEVVVKRVGDLESLKVWSCITARGFSMPDFVIEPLWDWFAAVGLDEESPVQHYLGWVNGEPVATSTVCYGAGVAGIYRVATLPQARGRGIGAVVTLAPLDEARAKGFRVATLYASPMGVNIYRRMGFKEYCRIVSYLREV